MMNEMIQDSMEMDEDDIEDNDVDHLISNMEADIKAKKQKQVEANMMEQEDEAL